MTLVQKEVVAAGLEVPEGPVVLADDEVAFVEQVLGRVSLLTGGRVEVISESGGAPNAVTLGSDGYLYAAQNGGVVGGWRSSRPAEPSIERIGLDGTVETIATEVDARTLGAPNDLVFGPDGRLYFTDPGEPYDPSARTVDGRIFALGADGGEQVLELGASYPNGIAFDEADQLLWVETYDRLVCRLSRDGARRVLCELPEDHLPDGLAVAEDGRLFIATVASHGITVLSPSGELLDVLRLDDTALPSNCCFQGSVLWVTDFGLGWRPGTRAGRLWRIETDARGTTPSRGRLPLGLE